MAETEKPKGACVKLPRFESRSVMLMEATTSSTQRLAASSYIIAERGAHTCQVGVKITSKVECEQALESLRIPKIRVHDGQPCYSNYKGNGYATGKHGAGAHFICKKET